MNTQTLLIGIGALLIGGVGGYLIAGVDTPHDNRDSIAERADTMPMDGQPMSGDAATHSQPAAMAESAQMGHMMNMMVSSEREFITGMIPHHQEAVDTATEVIERGGTTPEIRQLVEDIVVAQEAEIADMQRWHQDWYDEPYVDTGEYEPMMRDLSGMSGAELDRVFLEDMVRHHMGAIMMARSVQPHIEHDEIAELTRSIVATQSAEISQMQQMLRSLE